MARLTHTDARGRARMVDVSAKRPTRRRAVAAGSVRFGIDAFALLRANRLAKGDALAVARIAGIQAAKRVADLVPLCHPVPLEHVAVEIELDVPGRLARVRAEAVTRWSTGVEMEALAAVCGACLALYDMTKAIDRGIVVERIELLAKAGGRSGRWSRAGSGGEETP